MYLLKEKEAIKKMYKEEPVIFITREGKEFVNKIKGISFDSSKPYKAENKKWYKTVARLENYESKEDLWRKLKKKILNFACIAEALENENFHNNRSFPEIEDNVWRDLLIDLSERKNKFFVKEAQEDGIPFNHFIYHKDLINLSLIIIEEQWEK
jgi:hypothetical protein